ncbi:MAG: glycosyltransferase [Pseudomonadota bacterium]
MTSDQAIAPRVSVVLLTHRRPHLLSRVVHGIAQLDYPDFEFVVVGDLPSIHDYGLRSEWASRIRYAQLEEQNVCKSRNIGIALSSGEIVAFCDDDAVPEPNWLSELVLPFQTDAVGAVAGAVRGADGVRMEWSGGWFDRTGHETPANWTKGIKIASSKSQITKSRFLALMGVNTAFRRKALVGVGGFDEAYHYYLDETDMALRLARAGWASAYVAEAQVHHLREANVARDALKTPRNLFQIAASKAYFCQRHLPPKDVEPALNAFRNRRIAELDPYIRLGSLRRAGRDALIAQMDQGLAEGTRRQPGTSLDSRAEKPPFQAFLQTDASRRLRLAVISGWGVGPILRARKAALRLAEAGHSVTCISFLSGPQAMSVTFDRGVWLHRGGTWQVMDILRRGGPVLRHTRAHMELKRMMKQRDFELALYAGRSSPQDRAIAAHPSFGAIWAKALALPHADLPMALQELNSVLFKPAINGTHSLQNASLNQESERLDLAQQPLLRYNQTRAGAGS